MMRPRRLMISLAAAFTMIALVPGARMLASPAPSLVMLIDFVMVTAPYPPGSRTLISPPAVVFEIAPAKVLHGATREHGLASSPVPETHVRVACAWASDASIAGPSNIPMNATTLVVLD